jgi:hypothetical protein
LHLSTAEAETTANLEGMETDDGMKVGDSIAEIDLGVAAD